MARVGDNHPLKGAHGLIGHQMVARTMGDNTYLSMRPVFDENIQPSEAQLSVRDRLAEGTAWGQSVLANPVYANVYKRTLKRGQRVFNCAVSDYMRPPEIMGITVGDYLSIDARDNFRVTSVGVRLLGADGSVLETGMASLDPIDLLTWQYLPVLADWQTVAVRIQVSACDLPGNIARKDFLL